jgi:glycosyltransferase involved in cell wall biosynthesis
LTEAALGAAPVVAYDIDWQGEMILDGQTGRLVRHGDLRGMAEATAELLADPARAAGFGRRLREFAGTMLDPKALDDHEREQYARLIANGRAAEAMASAQR